MNLTKSKCIPIKNCIQSIIKIFGENYFLISDFWDADDYAVGLRKDEKLIYISNWDFKHCSKGKARFYSELELIDPTTFETKEVIKKLKGLTQDELIKEINAFVLM
jgi:hypothetical protein